MWWVRCRAAGALEEAAREHKKRTGRPFVLVIDAVDRLAQHCPDILETLQACPSPRNHIAPLRLPTAVSACIGCSMMSPSQLSKSARPEDPCLLPSALALPPVAQSCCMLHIPVRVMQCFLSTCM